MKVTSQAGVNLIKSFEGFTSKAFRLQVGTDNNGNPIYDSQYYTYGYGHCGADVKAGATITKAEAETLLRQDLKYYENCVNNKIYCPVTASLNQNQFDALVSFCYNCGAGGLQYLCSGKTISQIGVALPTTYVTSNGVYLQGLVNRRKKEQALYQGTSSTVTGDEDEMKVGSNNDATLLLKQNIMLLKSKGIIKQGVDDNGYYGDGTNKAVKEIQKTAGITVDGIFGPQTARATVKLIKDYCAKQESKISSAKKALG